MTPWILGQWIIEVVNGPGRVVVSNSASDKIKRCELAVLSI
jgi:hypothetical protein